MLSRPPRSAPSGRDGRGRESRPPRTPFLIPDTSPLNHRLVPGSAGRSGEEEAADEQAGREGDHGAGGGDQPPAAVHGPRVLARLKVLALELGAGRARDRLVPEFLEWEDTKRFRL